MRDEMIVDDQGLAEEIWRAQRTMEEELPAVSESKSVEPLTYSKFLECVDMRRRERYGNLKSASVNKFTLAFLIGSMRLPGSAIGTGGCQIFGVQMEIDERLPDHAIKIDGVIYNAPKESSEDPRDTQFAGFAKLLLEEFMQTRALDIANAGRTWNAGQVQKLFAQRGYDLVEHAFIEMNPIAPQCCNDASEMVEDIPDMTEWPEK